MRILGSAARSIDVIIQEPAETQQFQFELKEYLSRLGCHGLLDCSHHRGEILRSVKAEIVERTTQAILVCL